MNDYNHFPDVVSPLFNEKDQLCHSLVEAALFNQNSNDFVLSMLTKLKCYADENGNDMIIDVLFMKYLIKNRSKHYNEEINNFNAKLIKKQKISQYIIAYVCFNDPKSKFNFKNQIYSQSNKMMTNEEITVNGVKISKVICFYILKTLFDSFPKNINMNQIYDNKNHNTKIKSKHYSHSNCKDDDDIFSLNFDIHDENDFVKLLLLRAEDKNKYNYFIVKQRNEELMYIASKDIDLSGLMISSGIYSIIKKDVFKRNVEKYENNDIIKYYNDDFIRFVQKAIKNFEGEKKIDSIKLYVSNITCIERKIEMIFELIYMKEYDEAIVLLNKLDQVKEVADILTDELHFQTIKDLFDCVKVEYACEFIKRFSIEDKLTRKQKLSIVFISLFPKKKLIISRKNILNDSMDKFEDNDMHHKIIKIRYESEEGIDEGGLSKDWFTNVNDEIIKSNAFIPTPNGTSLTINNQNDNLQIYKFTGQIIASAFINRKNIDIKLSSFIWKKMMNENIDLEDMKEYDNELYESLKWISENDPEPLMMTFVDSDDIELCVNGQNIELKEENKEEFIHLMIEKKLIQQNSEAIDQITLGFQETIDLNIISIFNWNDIKEIINGKETIDIDDWKKHTKYEFQYEKNYEDFFTIISKWSHEKLQKLLKFSTGSSVVPVQGFKYFDSTGGLFQLRFLQIDSNRLPESHTCFNRIDIPCYNTIEQFENKLSLAIECDTFTIE